MKSIKKLILICLPTLLTSVTLTPAITTYAASQSIVTDTGENQYDMQSILKEAEQNPYLVTEIDGDNFTITFTDADVYRAIGELQGIKIIRTPRANGVNKIEGNVVSGKFKVYITGNTLNAVKGVGGSALSFLLGGGLGFVASSIYNIARADNNFKHGRVFVYSGHKYQYWYYQ